MESKELGRPKVDAEDLAVAVGVIPVATRAWTGTTRPPSRTSRTRASAATNVTGPRLGEGPGAELLDVDVEFLGHLRDLRLAQRGDAERGD